MLFLCVNFCVCFWSYYKILYIIYLYMYLHNHIIAENIMLEINYSVWVIISYSIWRLIFTHWFKFIVQFSERLKGPCAVLELEFAQHSGWISASDGCLQWAWWYGELLNDESYSCTSMFGIFYASKIGSFKQTSWPILFIFRSVTSKYKKKISVYIHISLPFC